MGSQRVGQDWETNTFTWPYHFFIVLETFRMLPLSPRPMEHRQPTVPLRVPMSDMDNITTRETWGDIYFWWDCVRWGSWWTAFSPGSATQKDGLGQSFYPVCVCLFTSKVDTIIPAPSFFIRLWGGSDKVRNLEILRLNNPEAQLGASWQRALGLGARRGRVKGISDSWRSNSPSSGQDLQVLSVWECNSWASGPRAQNSFSPHLPPGFLRLLSSNDY